MGHLYSFTSFFLPRTFIWLPCVLGGPEIANYWIDNYGIEMMGKGSRMLVEDKRGFNSGMPAR